ncbi:cell wall hydrolase [Bacillus suaedaesalsae]|uniref:Cell wall hydrolase n=1 Tax=Bacillus suaedaesalsae TaxID=2810349 RepID=A0ABS2DN53_9BACI|nr:cell wall hydrolase [Bacillus suaedaesalsae]MBM6619889.1 cell wall hydrolase [Bacillus suaedaesalsae]
MRFQSFWRFPLVFVIILCFAVTLFPAQPSYAFSDQVIQRGATGEDVIELQARLQYNGYYHGPIDGVFGWSTYWSVRNFQKEFGLETVDGFVGQKSKDMLIRATKYYKDYVYQQINQGRRFTHYGGMPLNIQSAPSQATITKARKAAEQNRQTALNTAQKQGAKAPSGQQIQKGKAQTPTPQKAPNKTIQKTNEQQAAQQGTKAPEQQKQQGQQGTPTPAKTQGQKGAKTPAQKQGQQGTQTPAQQQGTPTPKQEQPAKQEQPKPAAPAPTPKKQEAAPEAPKATAVNMPNGFSQNDIQLLANAVYGEARGEAYVGQVAIAAVILNRINSPTFPDTVSGVIFEPGAFTAVADGQIWLTPNEQAKKAVLDAINGFDPTGEAMYYFNPDTATNKWIWSRPQIKRIGKHIFCK